MNVYEAAYKTTVYSYDVNLKAKEISIKYNHTLNKLNELTILINNLAEKIEDNIINEDDKLELKKFTTLLTFIRDEEIDNFNNLIKFTNWSVEQSLKFIKEYEDLNNR